MGDPQRSEPKKRSSVRGLRAVLAALAGGTAVVCLIALAFLRTGRPLHYTDGQDTVRAWDLVDAPTQLQGAPIPELEVPGPVRGRVLHLGDDRYVYGRVNDEGSTDLVLFEPDSGANPIPLVTLNSPYHEFSPSLSADGSLLFCTDRPGGVGGFDLWSSNRLSETRFGRPQPFEEPINTVDDEVDPAESPDGDALVFARRIAGGRDTKLWIAEGLLEPRPLFEDAGSPGELRIERDPAFSSDGVSLWFVRSVDRADGEVLRSWRHRGAFTDPCPGFDDGAGRGLRAPVFDGGELWVLGGNDELPTLQRSTPYLVYPWWAAQRGLELLLIALLAGSLVLLGLLLLGARWRKLDIVTWCLLASLLVHLLLWLYLEGMRILEPDPVPGPGEAEFAVRVANFDTGSGAVSGGALDGPSRESIQDEPQFRPDDQALSFEAPEAALADQQPASSDLREAVRIEDQTVDESSLQQLQTEATSVADRSELRAEARPDQSAAARAGAQQLASVDASRSVSERAELSAAEQSAIAVSAPAAAAVQRAAPTSRPDRTDFADVVLPTKQSELSPTTTEVSDRSTVRAAAVADAGLDGRATAPLAKTQATNASAAAPSRSQVADADTFVVDGPARDGITRRTATTERPRRVLTPDLPVAAATPTVPKTSLSDRPTRRVAAAKDAASSTRAADVALSDVDRSASTAEPTATPDGPVAAPETALGKATPARPESTLNRRRSRPRPESVKPTDLVAKTTPRPTLPKLSDRTQVAEASTSADRSDQAAKSRADALDLGETKPTLAKVDEAATPSERPGEVSKLDAKPTRPSSSLRRGRRTRRSTPTPTPVSEVAKAREVDVTVPKTKPESRQADTKRTTDAIAVARAADALRPVEVPAERPEVERPEAARPEPVASLNGLRVGLRVPETAVRRRARTAVTAPVTVPVVASLYSNRFGPAKQAALRKFGGSAETEQAVRDGLAYLATLQKKSGFWTTGHREQKYGDVKIGRTALCVLAFLGAGHTHQSDTEYSENVRLALNALIAQQDAWTGHFGRRTSSYSHGITTYALAECYAITKDDRLRAPLERAVQRIVGVQNGTSDRRSRGGWGYFSATLQADDGFARTSITAWMVMALESAKLSGVEVPAATMEAAETFLWSMFDPRRELFLYAKDPSRLRSRWPTLPASTPASVFCLLLMGADPQDERIDLGFDYTFERRPRSYKPAGDDDFVLRAKGHPYFWYYGTLASFLAGGERWERWNESLKKTLLAGQRSDGAFPPIGAYADYAGDNREDCAFTTALCVLSLEVYYRYFTPLLEGR